MTSATLVARSLCFYWRTHVGVLLGTVLSTAILVGALVIGDSVRGSLRALALARLGSISLALAPQDRFFRAKLSDDLESAMGVPVAPALLLRGVAANADGSVRASRVQVVGVDGRFWSFGASRPMPGDGVVLNGRLAEELGVHEGDTVVLRVEKPSPLPRDAPLSLEADASAALRLNVTLVAGDADFGRFSLQANQVPPFNAFVPLERLQRRANVAGRVNALLVGGDASVDAADAALRERWQLADADLELRELPEQGVVELRTDRVFIEPPVARVAEKAAPGAVGVLSYFVNELRVGERATPYSIVAATADARLVPPGTGDDQIIINSWLADDLQAKPGDSIKLTYFVLGQMGKLEERTTSFTIRAIVPMEGPTADRELLPGFPGVANIDNCRDWKPGIPIELTKIRPKDEAYWKQHRGTPKAFVTLSTGQRLWGNRFGELTAVRFPLTQDARAKVEQAMRRELDPASVGLHFQPVREHALAASAQSMDFGQLFLGFSCFLEIAALLLTGLLFVFSVQQRAEEVGTLLALGFPPARVRRLMLYEGGMLALLGGIIGTGCGVFYTRGALYGLSQLLQRAVGSGALSYHAEPATLMVGAAAGVAVSLAAIWLSVLRQARRPARELLALGAEPDLPALAPPRSRARRAFTIALALAMAALVLLVPLQAKHLGKGSPGVFFAAGALLLASGIVLCYGLLLALARYVGTARMTIGTLGLRGCARRRGRSLATIGLLACGSFILVAVGANRHDPAEDSGRRGSGTGGFALFAETTLPALRGIGDLGGAGAKAVALRMHEGDDASCLNLNRAQAPRLLGVRPEELASRGSFTFVKTALPAEGSPWLLLKGGSEDGVVPAIGDQATITWALGKSVGDELPYTDERGETFRLRLVGMLANSILQGSLVISEEDFIARFPSESGYRVFLIDAPSGDAAAVSSALRQQLEDYGLVLTPAVQRLAAFNAVENVYLSIFQALGGLGLLLGSAGLGVVVLRNVLERRGELALLRAVGFRSRSLHWLMLWEHWGLLLAGLVCGVGAAAVAVLPALSSPGAQVPYGSLALTICAVVISGALWTWLAIMAALRGPLLAALRSE